MAIPPRARRARRPETPRSLKREETKQRLIEAAEEWFSEHGYENVSVSEIAARAGVVPSLINTYFLGKAGLLYAVVQRHNMPQWDVLLDAGKGEGTAFARLIRVVSLSAELDTHRIRLYAALMALSWSWPAETERQNIAERAPFIEMLRGLVREGIATGEMRAMPVEDAVDAIWWCYAMGLRPSVFGLATPAECTARIIAVLTSMLKAEAEAASPPVRRAARRR
jgi:AcrR family transcriptional regulator